MAAASHLLLLAGSAEARAIAEGLHEQGVAVTASLMEPGHWAGPLPVPTRVGGFGGAARFLDYLAEKRITGVIDATHPFAARISARTWEMCQARQIPCLQVLRPPWQPGPGDRWTDAEDAADALAALPEYARVFITTGRGSLAGLRPRHGQRYFVRRLTEAHAPSDSPGLEYVPGQGPFSVADEVTTFRRLGITHLLCQNAGGEINRTKLDAARALDLPVSLLRRPPPSGAPIAETVEDALTWTSRICR